eukprot:TRINITY_DN63786_c0_g1_i1.p1 TRINITY_DN63786_c0_g1~~TRINITY_DN63786_c0_g1_i1.p1  ORF type:complete len:255 (-),score=40.09 TRINITY_DN63786_c0_g1_i1:209-973(-)
MARLFLLANLFCAAGAIGLRGNLTQGGRHAPCHCKTDAQEWQRANRADAKCVFIDLGAGSGRAFEAFVADKFGPVKNCPHGTWEAILVEANPNFEGALRKVSDKYGSQVRLSTSTAAYMCESQTSFYLDTKEPQANFWGSSLSSNHPNSMKGGLDKVAVSTMNLNRLLTESTLADDYVIVNMDVEGAEFDIIPCLAESPAASLIDRLYMEQHDPSWGLEGATPAIMQTALAGLRTRGIDIPSFSPLTTAVATTK